MKLKIQQIKSFLKSKGFRQTTIKTYCSIIGKAINSLDKLTEESIENYLENQNLSPRTYNLQRTVLNFYTQKYLGFSLKFTKAKVNKSLPTYVTKEELKAVIDTIPNLKHKLGLALMYGSGLRIYEVCRIKKHDINLDSQTLMVKEGKCGKDRITIIPTITSNALDVYINKIKNNSNPYLFQTYRGHISERSFQERLKKGIKDSKITKYFTAHDLRHSFAINLLNKKVDIETVRKLLGHSSLRTTQIYLQCQTIDLTALAKSV